LIMMITTIMIVIIIIYMPHYLRERYQISPVFLISPTVISQQGGAVSYERKVTFGATMAQVNAVFSHRRLLGIAETCVGDVL
jgi:hypothetical protein